MIDNDKVIHLDLDTSKEEKIITEIESAMSDIHQKRQDMGFTGLVRMRWDLYDGVVDPNEWGPWAGSAHFNMQIVRSHCDIIGISALRQEMGIHPLMLLEPRKDNLQLKDIRNRENRLDYILRKDIELEKLLKSGVNTEACVQGTSFVKVCHTYEVENVTYVKTYKPRELDKYKVDSWKQYKHSLETRTENIRKLENNEEIAFEVNEARDIYFGPKAYRVPIEDLYLRPDIKDLQRQRLIAEKLNYTWKDIQNKLDTGYFREKAVDQIRSNNEEDYFSKDYVLYECILYAKIDKKFQRYVITYEPDSKAVLRAIHYPYNHGKIYYVPYYVKERDGSVYGYSIAEILKDSDSIINNLWNSLIDRSALDNNPPLEVPQTLDLNAYEWGPNSWIPSETPGSIRVLQSQTRSVDDLKLITTAQMYAEMLDGVSAGQLSGQANPADPTSPASKHAMQLRSSSFRIEDYIINLQYGNELLSEQVEKLINQYKDDYIQYYYKGEMQDIEAEILEVDVLYKAHGTSLTINKGQQLALVEQFMIFLMTYYPDLVQQNPNIRQILLGIYINNMGGLIEQKKDEILPEQPLEMPRQLGMEAQAGAGAPDIMAGLSEEEQAQVISDLQEMTGQQL